jgi:hypothetical protein
LFGLLRSAGDVWCCALELNSWRRQRHDPPLVGYKELCRELAASGPGTFGELDTAGARSVLRRYSDAWFAAAKRRRAGDNSARFPRRRRALLPVRWYAGTFTLDGRRLRLPTARGCAPLLVRLGHDLPYPHGQVRSVTLLCEAGRLYADVTAEVLVAAYPDGLGPVPGQVAGIDLGSFTRTRLRGQAGRCCWFLGGRSAPNAISTCAMLNLGAAPSRDAPRRAGSAGHGDGASTAAGSRRYRPGTGGGSARHSMRLPGP